MSKDSYIRFRVSSAQKALIDNRASDLGLSVTDYIMNCVYRDLYFSDDSSDFVSVPVPRKCLEIFLK